MKTKNCSKIIHVELLQVLVSSRVPESSHVIAESYKQADFHIISWVAFESAIWVVFESAIWFVSRWTSDSLCNDSGYQTQTSPWINNCIHALRTSLGGLTWILIVCIADMLRYKSDLYFGRRKNTNDENGLQSLKIGLFAIFPNFY